MPANRLNRWVILAAGVIINLCIGSNYAWSVFQKPLVELFGWSTAATSLVFTISSGVVPLAMIVAGNIQDRIGPTKVVLAGGLLFGAGVSGLYGFVAVLAAVGLCFGGFMGIDPSITADTFGPKNWGMNYGVMFTAFGTAAFVGPRLAATMKETQQGDYTYAFLIAAVLGLVGIALTMSHIFATRVVARRAEIAGHLKPGRA